MAYIANELISKLLLRYSELWGVDGGPICWEVVGRELADRLTNKTNHLLTVDVVRYTANAIKTALRQLDKSKGRTTLCARLWYAYKLGLTHAVDRMTKQMIVDRRINIEIDYNDFLRFDETDVMDKRFLPQLEQMTEELIEEMTEELLEQMTEELIEQMTGKLTGEQTPISLQSSACYDSYNNIYNSHNSSCNMYDEAARKHRNRRFQPVGDQHKIQEEAESVVPDIEALRESQNRATLQKPKNSAYTKRRPDRSVYKIVLVYDCVHILEAHYKKLKHNPRYDTSITAKLQQRNETSCKFRAKRGGHQLSHRVMLSMEPPPHQGIYTSLSQIMTGSESEKEIHNLIKHKK
uniref:Uncharacterized protein n=1 Tax=Glossina palpalis gambiensis TaxID=67801 RepID=A0A1B0BXG1_9MUSC